MICTNVFVKQLVLFSTIILKSDGFFFMNYRRFSRAKMFVP